MSVLVCMNPGFKAGNGKRYRISHSIAYNTSKATPQQTERLRVA